MSLANKYRPSTWSDMVEQNLVVSVLSKMCNSELTNRNFLLTGPAGTGKTTSAKIIANYLNPNGGEIIELDAASNNGIDDIRSIIAQAKTYPLQGNYKVFIIDECHALSNAAWQSLLIILETAPAKSVFILCTTNPEKIPATVISRVQVFQLSKISLDGIYNRLCYVLDKEIADGSHLSYENDAVMYIAKLANGGMRDALTLLDKAIAFSSNITSKTITAALGLANYDDYFSLLLAITKRDNANITTIIFDIYNSGINFIKWIEGFQSFVVNIVKFIYLKDINKTMIPSHYEDKIKTYTEAHALICLRLSNKLVSLINELKLTSYQQDLAITYLCSSVKK